MTLPAGPTGAPVQARPATGRRGDPAGAWEQLATAIRACRACPPLAATRTHVVVGTCPPGGARLLIVGEAPGAAEDAQGEPFVGRSGQLLDEALAGAGLPRGEVAVVNVLKCRPPGNRPPRRVEVASCRPWLDAQLRVVDPQLVLALGTSAATAFFGPRARVGALRGRVHLVDGRPVLVSYHPAAALRSGPRGAAALGLRADLTAAAGILAASGSAGRRDRDVAAGAGEATR